MSANSDISVSPPQVEEEDVELRSPPENVRNGFKKSGPVGFSLRGGGADEKDEDDAADYTDNDADPDDEEEEVELGKAALAGKMNDEDEEDIRRRRWRRIAILVCLAFLAFLVILAVVFSVGAVPLGRTVVNAPETASPTSAPIIAPTRSPTTLSPTASPIAPTFSEDSPLSTKTCPEISAELSVIPPGTPFNDEHTKPDGTLACGDTYAGFDPERPNRNVWTARVGRKDCVLADFEEGTQICEEVGARRCTADELQFGAAQGSGCGGDDFLLYTSTACNDNGTPGIFLINLSLKKNDTFFECQTDLSRTTITRCCADFVIA